MASRAEQKAQARAKRIEFERQLAESQRRKQRLMRLGGVGLIAVIIIIVAVVVSSKNSTPPPVKLGSTAQKAAVTRVTSLLSGIPESGNNTLGNPNAPVQITFYGDLECSACDEFALPTNVPTSAGVKGSGLEEDIINDYVKTGKASIVYRSLDTATGNGATPSVFPTQQAAAYAAGLQGKAWYYIELFYNEQQAEGSSYVNQTFLDNIAKQIPGLNYTKWLSDLTSDTSLVAQVSTDGTTASQGGYNSTPTLVIKGPKGQASPISGVPTGFSEIQSAIKSVS